TTHSCKLNITDGRVYSRLCSYVAAGITRRILLFLLAAINSSREQVNAGSVLPVLHQINDIDKPARQTDGAKRCKRPTSICRNANARGAIPKRLVAATLSILECAASVSTSGLGGIRPRARNSSSNARRVENG